MSGFFYGRRRTEVNHLLYEIIYPSISYSLTLSGSASLTGRKQKKGFCTNLLPANMSSQNFENRIVNLRQRW